MSYKYNNVQYNIVHSMRSSELQLKYSVLYFFIDFQIYK